MRVDDTPARYMGHLNALNFCHGVLGKDPYSFEALAHLQCFFPVHVLVANLWFKVGHSVLSSTEFSLWGKDVSRGSLRGVLKSLRKPSSPP